MEEVIHQRRCQLQLQERRACRRNKLKFTSRSEENDRVSNSSNGYGGCQGGHVSTRIYTAAVDNEWLTSLRRWYLQLKMMIVDDLKQTRMDKDDDMETALQACKTELLRDQRCYDVVYRAGLRASDVRESLLDEGAPMDYVLFSSSEYVNRLQTELERLLNEDSPVDAVINYTWKTLKAQQPVE
ncbi:unnamed protein product [Peronospora destructor]|uniref:Uncharacterized protein n=1 Tax=Peronospora destructor TaxID=86335 RepID=A0AAV0TAR3_9STRA|nr:unnamed protein product [Peronospora destructor]